MTSCSLGLRPRLLMALGSWPGWMVPVSSSPLSSPRNTLVTWPSGGNIMSQFSKTTKPFLDLLDPNSTTDFLLYTARSQHAEIENSHSQRGKSEQALLKLYCKVLALPAHEFRVEVRVFN